MSDPMPMVRWQYQYTTMWQHQRLNSDEGYQALSVFFPGMQQQYHQTTGRIAANYQLQSAASRFSAGIGWGSRAPTMTEAYGYYLNNTFDQYDYIGNPRLKNESAIEENANYQVSSSDSRLSFGLDANAFFFYNYIIGQFERRLSAMTVGAEGVKVYGNIGGATIANISLSADWQPLKQLRLHGPSSTSRPSACSPPAARNSASGWASRTSRTGTTPRMPTGAIFRKRDAIFM